MIHLEIPGIPIPLSRHRSALVGCKIRQYDSQKVKKSATQAMILSKIQGLYGPRLLTYGSYDVTLIFNFYKPKQSFYLNDWGFENEHTDKPDLDNLVKYILDCGNRVLWTDDSKVVRIMASKRFWKKSSTEIYIMPKKTRVPTKSIDAVAREFTPEELINFCKLASDLLYFLNNSCDTASVEDASGASSAVQEMASKYAEKLMRVKKHGEKNGLSK